MLRKKTNPIMVIDPTNPEHQDQLTTLLYENKEAILLSREEVFDTLTTDENCTPYLSPASLLHTLIKYTNKKNESYYVVLANKSASYVLEDENEETGRYIYQIIGKLKKKKLPTGKLVYEYKEKPYLCEQQEISEQYKEEDFLYEETYTPKQIGVKKAIFFSKQNTSFCLFLKKRLEGETLASLMVRKNEGKIILSFEDYLEISLAILQATHNQVHMQGFIHRNITPHYIRISRDHITHEWRATITHFTHSKQFDDRDKEIAFRGNRFYAAPELLMKKGSAEDSDLFAIGCVIAELCGQNPHDELDLSKFLPEEKVERKEKFAQLVWQMKSQNWKNRCTTEEAMDLLTQLIYSTHTATSSCL